MATSETMHRRWSDPEQRAAFLAHLAALTSDPDVQARKAAAMTGRKQSELTRAKKAAALRAAWSDPEKAARMANGATSHARSPEGRRRRSESKIRACAGTPSGIAVPGWVPADLRGEFLEMAALLGEEGAASHVRRLKREAA